MNRDEAPLEESLERYRILSEMTSDYAFKFRIEPDGLPVLEWISESFVRDFGFYPDEPSDIFERVHQEDRAHVAEAMQELYSGRPVEGEIRVMPGSGGELWVHYRVKPVVDSTGRVVGTYGSLQDIHDRKMAEELWRQAEARFRAQYQSSPIPTFTWQRVGDDFVLIDFNRAAEAFTRGGVSRLLGKTARQLYRDEDDIVSDLTRCFETGETIVRDMRYRFHSIPDVRDLRVTVARVPPNLVMVHTVDLTDVKRIEAEHRELLAKLEGG